MAAHQTAIQCSAPGCPLASDISAHNQSIKDIASRQDRQDDDTKRLEDKIDGLRNWIMGSLFAGVLSLFGVVANLLKH